MCLSTFVLIFDCFCLTSYGMFQLLSVLTHKFLSTGATFISVFNILLSLTTFYIFTHYNNFVKHWLICVYCTILMLHAIEW